MLANENLFPPVLITQGVSTLIGQKYVESFPTSALCLISRFAPGRPLVPPSSLVQTGAAFDSIMGDAYVTPDFKFEPYFPLLYLDWVGQGESGNSNDELVASRNRFVTVEYLEQEQSDQGGVKAMYNSIRHWLDAVCGW